MGKRRIVDKIDKATSLTCVSVRERGRQKFFITTGRFKVNFGMLRKEICPSCRNKFKVLTNARQCTDTDNKHIGNGRYRVKCFGYKCISAKV